jgi:glycosyltransferase involved in cell wall biosynthesis
MPSTNEGFGLAYLEAMRAGRPCIAFHGAADEILQNGVTGLIVDSDTELTDAIVRLFRDPDLRHRMGAAAAATVARQFTLDQFTRRFCAAVRAAAVAAPTPLAVRPRESMSPTE